MSKALRAHTSVPVIVLVAMLVAAFSPSAYAVYRCEAMATTLAAPCCASHQDPQASSSQNPQLKSRCCSSETVSLDRLPSELCPHSETGALAASTSAVAVLPPPPSFVAVPWRRTRAHSESGPPIVLKVCSLLI